jgi:serine/threonine-protein kinase
MTAGSSPAPRFGRYQVLGRIGIGGMGEVFRALSLDGHAARVALKLMRPEHSASEHHVRMFTAEAEVGRRLTHPNIVRVIDHGLVEKTPYIAFELVEGVSLDRVIDAGPLDAGLAAHVALEVLAGLAYAHERGLVHRDVSATNVLLSTVGEVKLADFGVVKVRGLELTRTNEIKGKPAYMAPEQLRSGGAIDGRVDVFAVGVLLHRMTEGRGPFTDVAEWLMEGAPLRVRGALRPVLDGALAVLPDRRFASAALMARAIRRAVRVPGDAPARLVGRVRGLMKAERPLQALDRLIIAEFAEASSSRSSPLPVAAPTASAQTPRAATKTVERPRLTLLRGGGKDPDEPDTIPHRTGAGADHPALDAPDSFDDIATSPLRPLLLPLPSTSPHAVEDDDATIEDRFAARAAQLPASARTAASARAAAPRRPHLRRVHVAAALLAGVFAATVALVARRSPAPRVTPQNTPQTVTQTPSQTAPQTPATVTIPIEAEIITDPQDPAEADPITVKPRRVRPAPPAARGSLTLDTEPWGVVWLGTRRLGTTPFARVALPAGRAQLSVDLEASGKRKSLAVKIAPNAETRLSVRLR